MKKKIHKLAVDFQPGFRVLGISSHQNDYRLSWALNSALGLNLSKISNLKIEDEKTTEIQEFSVFSYEDESGINKYDLISNRCHDGFLLAEYKNVDFLMLIHGDMVSSEIETLLKKIKNIEIITMVFELSKLSSRSKQKLIF